MINFEIPTRDHWIILIRYMIKSIYEVLIILVLMLIKFKILIGLVVSLIILVSFFKWKNKVFRIEGDMFIEQSGIFNKKKKEIPLDKITTVDMEQGIIYRFFNLVTLKIDTGASHETGAEIELTLKRDYAEKLRMILIQSREEETVYNDLKINEKDSILKQEQNNINKKLFKVPPIELIKYALTKNKFGYLVGIFIIFDKFDIFITKNMKNYLNNNMEISFNNMKEILLKQSLIIIIIEMILIIVLSYILVSILSSIMQIIKYKDFTLWKLDNKINIEYGMCTKKKYSFFINKIQGVRLKQNLLQQLLGVFIVEVIIIGYGDNNDKKAFIYPLANKKLVNKIIEELLPEFKFTGIEIYPERKTKNLFIYIRIFLSLIPLCIVMHLLKILPISWKVTIGVIVVAWQYVMGYINYRNTSIGITKELIKVTNRSFNKSTYLIKQRDIQSISISQNILQKFKSVCSYSISICSNKIGHVVTIKNMNIKISEILEKNMDLK